MDTLAVETRQYVALEMVLLSLEEMYNGCEKHIEVVSKTGCHQCQTARDTNCSECGFQLVEVLFPKGTNLGFSNFPTKSNPDKLVTIEVLQKPHDHYSRHEKHLFAYVALSFKEALCGFKKLLPTLDGDYIVVQPKEGKVIVDQEILVVRNKGMPTVNSHGNLYIKFSVKIPKQLDRNVTRKLADILPREFSTSPVF